MLPLPSLISTPRLELRLPTEADAQVLEGVLRRHARDHHGAPRDTRIYALLDLADLREG